MAFVERHARPAIGHEGQQHHGLVQYAIVLDVAQQHRRGAVLDFGEPDSHAGRAADHRLVRIGEKCDRAASTCRRSCCLTSDAPLRHDSIMVAIAAPTMSGKPAAVDDLHRIGDQERRIDRAERRDDRNGDGGRPAPSRHRDPVEQDRGGQHGAGNRDAVGGGEIIRSAEQHDGQQRARHQQPIGGRHVDLTGLVARGRNDPRARTQSHQHRLPGQREHAGDQRLRGDDGGKRREHNHRDQRPAGRQLVERIVGRGGSARISAPWPK